MSIASGFNKSSYLTALLALASITQGGTAALAACTGPGAPTTTQTKCLTAVVIPGNALRSYDISWVNPDRAEYYLADRSNKGIDIIDTQNLTFKRTITGFVGIKLNTTTPPAVGTAVDNNHSGPDGVTSHGRWLYAGDGDSTLKVIDLNAPTASAIKQTISTGGTTRLDEMALTTDGRLLFAANNAEDPPFGTMFAANGDDPTSHVVITTKVLIDNTIVPAGAKLSIEQPAWDPRTRRFVTSVPIIKDNPTGCNYGQLPGAITCDGGLLIINPATLGSGTVTIGAFNPTTNVGVLKLQACGPNGASVGVHDNVLLGCTPGNNPSNTSTQVMNLTTKNFANIGNITGSDEVWFNAGDRRYYTASSRNPGGAVLGVINAETNLLIEKIPQSSGSHSVAADSKRNLIFVPESATAITVVPGDPTTIGGDTTAVGAGICGGTNGCIGVYRHKVEDDEHDEDDDHDHGRDRR